MAPSFPITHRAARRALNLKPLETDMKRLLASAALAATTLAASMATAQDSQDLVTIITSPEPQTQLIARPKEET
jgi:hypothetical protein